MKFSNYLTQIEGVSMYPVISLILFVAFFTIVTLWVYRTPEQTLKQVEKLPLDQ